MATQVAQQIRAGSVDELKAGGCRLVTGGGHAIAVIYHDGQVYAVDNRCPHMGFPLDRGSVKDGILTCHWHNARFDLASGGTFNPFADDVRSFPVTIKDGQVWVDPQPVQRDEEAHWVGRLRDGLEHNIRLVTAKSVLGLHAAGADYRAPLRVGADFGTTYSAAGWGAAMTMLTAAANMLPHLAEEDRPVALYQGLLHVSRECAGRPPRFVVDPLPTGETRPEVFKQWFRNFIDVRDEDAAERSLRTAIELGIPPRDIADMIFAAATDHIYLDAGHTLDFANKAFELLDHIGWEHASNVLTSLVHGMARARRSQELSAWRHPIDLASLLWQARDELPSLFNEGKQAAGWDDADALAQHLLGDNPADILEAIKDAMRAGATAEQLGSVVAHSAFLRMAHFHVSNEFNDWDTVHNTLTAANALHRALQRAPSPELLRGVFDVAMNIYLDRFLNMPAQRIPETGHDPVDGPALLAELRERMDVRQQVEEVSHLVSRYLTGGADPDPLVAALGRAMLSEDSGFHSFQIVDAGFNQYRSRQGTESGRHVLIGMARYLAAHAPTPRAVGQTYQIALRLHRGEEIFRE
ncbi:MAG: Rieske (2Fe-2S) protein [Chloroflexota bacterium]|nr:Rieske (2Fe-2S) protein [Chloroflexota bacterium]